MQNRLNLIRKIHGVGILLLLLFAGGCKSPTDQTVVVNTPAGEFEIRLYDETVKYRDNFLTLVKNNYYDSLLFHRVIPDVIIQGGDPSSKNAPQDKFLGEEDVNYTLPPDFRYVHTYGAVAAARKGDSANPRKRSSGAQFFIVMGPPVSDEDLNKIEKEKNFTYTEEQRRLYKLIGGLPQFDQDYTVFGEVVSGMDVVEKISRAPRDPDDRPAKDVPMSVKLNPRHDKK